MHTNPWFWIAFNFGVLCVLAMAFWLPAQGTRSEREGGSGLDCCLGGAFARVQRADLVSGGTGESVRVSDWLPGGIFAQRRQHLCFRTGIFLFRPCRLPTNIVCCFGVY
jgi:hypothetical protein